MPPVTPEDARALTLLGQLYAHEAPLDVPRWQAARDLARHGHLVNWSITRGWLCLREYAGEVEVEIGGVPYDMEREGPVCKLTLTVVGAREVAVASSRSEP